MNTATSQNTKIPGLLLLKSWQQVDKAQKALESIRVATHTYIKQTSQYDVKQIDE